MRIPALIPALLVSSMTVVADLPRNNPIAAYYSGAEGYPGWTDRINWSRAIDMSRYAKGATDFEKFENARDELAAQGGGILYYPSGTYDFSRGPFDGPNGRGLFLKSGVVIRGEAPRAGAADARNGRIELPTKFVFGFQRKGVDPARGFGGEVPRDWNVIGITPKSGEQLKDVRDVGLCWVNVVGATVYFGHQLNWGPTWATAGGWKSRFVKEKWKDRVPDGASPFDPLLGAPFGRTNFIGAGDGRVVFGCTLEDSAVLQDVFDEGNGPDNFYAYKFGPRISVYGSRVIVANNLLPASGRNFKYAQTTRITKVGRGGNSMILGDFVPDTTILFDYGKTCGVEVNKGLCGPWESGADLEGVIVRDNRVFNHGHRGFNLAGTWMTIANNHNERIYLKGGADVYGLGEGWMLTLDGNLRSNAGGNGAISDNLSRAFDLAGNHLWVDGNWFNNVGSNPGNDGEGILCQLHGGTHLTGWALTRNTHVRGTGQSSYIGSWDVDQRGCLIAWNETSGWVGVVNVRQREEIDCAYVANKAAQGVRTRSANALTNCPPAVPKAPVDVKVTPHAGDAVRISWSDASDNEIGFRVDRSLDEGRTWVPIAYRPPRVNGDDPDGLAWVDFTAPPGRPLRYRVVAVNCEDGHGAASQMAQTITLSFRDQ